VNTTSVILTSTLTCALGLGGALQAAQHQAPSSPAATHQGAGRYVQVEYPASTAANELQVGVTYNLWIPGGAPRLRCVIVHQHGAGAQASKGGETAAYDLHWQALAKKWDCALLGPFYHVLGEKTDTSPGGSELWMDPRLGSDKSFLEALEEDVGPVGASRTEHRTVGPVGTLRRRHLVQCDDHASSRARGRGLSALRLGGLVPF
jgi:hypothetical protein